MKRDQSAAAPTAAGAEVTSIRFLMRDGSSRREDTSPCRFCGLTTWAADRKTGSPGRTLATLGQPRPFSRPAGPAAPAMGAVREATVRRSTSTLHGYSPVRTAGWNRSGSATPRSRQIFRARWLLTSVCCGTALRLFSTGFCHHEWRAFAQQTATVGGKARHQVAAPHTAICSSW